MSFLSVQAHHPPQPRQLPPHPPEHRPSAAPAPPSLPLQQRRRWPFSPPQLFWPPRRPEPSLVPQPQTIEQVRVQLQAGKQPCYTDFHTALCLAGRSESLQARRDFLDLYNTYGAPKVTAAEAACEFLAMHTSYLYLEPGLAVDFYVQQDLFGVPDDSYARTLYVQPHIVDLQLGGAVYVLAPDLLRGRVQKKRVVVVPRGTAAGQARDVLSTTLPTGLRPDFDVEGIARTFVQSNREALLDSVLRPLSFGQKVTLAGHSLGGAIATRLMAELTPAQQQHCTLLTYNAPGLDRATAHKVVVPKQVRLLRAPLDLCTFAGEAHPRGTVIVPAPPPGPNRWRLCSHGVPRLAMQQLDGRPLQYRLGNEGPDTTWPLLECARRGVGHVAGNRITP